MRKYFSFAIAAGLLLAGAGCVGSTSTTVNVPQPAAQGRAVFTVTDATAALTNVTAVNITVTKVEAHSATEGWVTVSTATKQYDLLKLKQTNTAELLADANLAAGTYDQIRLEISKVEVTANGTTQEAKLPSTSLKIVGNLTITAGQTSTAALDFMVDKSLHITGNGKYILAPVVRLETKDDASVTIESNDKVDVNSGATESDETEGMDEKGEMKSGFELKDNLELDAQGMVQVHVK